MKNLISCFAALLIFLLTSVTNAEVLFYPDSQDKECISRIKLQGEITRETTKAISSVIDKNINHPRCIEKVSRIFDLDSDGGSVDEAIKIGNILRENEYWVFVREQDRCLSSCVLILASGIDRYAFGTVGIHRPYFSALDPSKSLDEIRKLRSEINLKISNYFDFMDVSKKLSDDMLSIEPEKIKLLSVSEMQEYRLIGKPASIDERDNAAFAYMYGLTSAEYRKKYQESYSICGKRYPLNDEAKFNENAEKRIYCQLSLVLGISEENAKRKNKLVIQTCGKLPKYPKSKRQNVWDCIRKIYVEK